MTSRILISLAIAAVLLWGCEGARASREPSSQTPVRPVKTITLKCRIDTAVEIEYIENGGVLHYVLRNLAKA